VHCVHVAMSNKELGQIGEDLAVEYLRANEYVILDRNWRSSLSELDIVARHNRTLVFCEVKTRRSENFGLPAEAVTAAKREHLRNGALAWLAAHQIRYSGMRFDVVGVMYQSAVQHSITHVQGIDV